MISLVNEIIKESVCTSLGVGIFELLYAGKEIVKKGITQVIPLRATVTIIYILHRVTYI